MPEKNAAEGTAPIEEGWEEIPSADSGWEEVPDEPTSPVNVQEPPQEMEHTLIPDFGVTVATPKGMDPADKHKLIYDSILAQKYENQSLSEPSVEGEQPIDIQGPVEAPPKKVPFSSFETIKGEFLDAGGAQERVPAETVTTEQTGTLDAITYPARRIASHVEKAAWAMYEGALRAEKAIYQYAPDRVTDVWIKGLRKEARVARLTRQIDYWSHPDKYGWVSPQADLDKRLNDETAYRRNYYYGLVNSVAESATDFLGFVTTIGMMPGGTPAASYAGKAAPYIAKNALHAVTTLAPYGLATTPGGIYERLHSSLILTAFGLVKPIVNLTGFRKISATMIATIANSALTSPEVIEMYKEKGFNHEFFKMFVPWLTMNFAFGVYMKDTPKAEAKAASKRFAKMMVKDIQANYDATVRILDKTVELVKKADKAPDAEVSGKAKAEIDVPKEIENEASAEVSSQGAAGSVEPTTPEAAPPSKVHYDFKVPADRTEVGEPRDGKGAKTKHDFSEDWMDPDTQEGLLFLKSTLETLEESRYTLIKGPQAGENGGPDVVTGRMKVAGESPEHLRQFKPRKLHKGDKSDLDLVNELIITADNERPKKQTKRQHDRVAAMLRAEMDYVNRKMNEGEAFMEGRGKRPSDDPADAKEVIEERTRLEVDDMAEAKEPISELQGREINDLTREADIIVEKLIAEGLKSKDLVKDQYGKIHAVTDYGKDIISDAKDAYKQLTDQVKEAARKKEIWEMSPEEFEADRQQKRKSVGAAGDEPTSEIPLPEIPNEVHVTTMSGEKKVIRPKEDEAFSISPTKGRDGKIYYQLHDGVAYDISVAEANKLMEYAGVKKKNAENVAKDPFKYQDSNQEKVIHSGWEKGNTYRHLLEGTGDIFREVSGRSDKSYIAEKVQRFKRYIERMEEQSSGWTDAEYNAHLKELYGFDPKETRIHPEDSFQYANLSNKEKFDAMRKQWENQPTETPLQAKAKKMNLLMMDGKISEAYKLAGEILSEVSSGNKSVGAAGLKPGEGYENNPHYQAVKKALAEGKPVPEKAYASYPDLVKQYGEKEPAMAPVEPPSKPPAGPGIADRIPGEPNRAESQFAKELVSELENEGMGQSEIAKYFKSDMTEQRDLAVALRDSNPEFFEAVAMGKADMPAGSSLYGISVFAEAVNTAKANKDGAALLRLSESPYAEMVSQAGSTLSAVSHLISRDELDPMQAISKIKKYRDKNPSLTYKALEEKLKQAEEKLRRAEAAPAKEGASSSEKRAFGAKNKLFTKQRADEAAKTLRVKLMGRFHSGVDPTALKEVVEIGGFYVEGGVREFKDWSAKMVSEFGEKIKPYLAEAWKQIQDRVSKESLEKAKVGIKQIIDSEGELSDITTYLKEINRQVQASGIKGQDKVLDAIYEIVREVAPDMTKQEMRDALSGYGKYKLLSKDELDVQIRDIKGQWQKIAALEDLMKKQAPKKTGVERRTPSDEERALIKQVNELKKKYNIQTTNPETQLKSALDSIKTRLTNQIKDLETQIDSKQKIVKETTPPPSDAEVVALRKTRDMLKAEYDKIFFTPMSSAKRIDLATKSAQRTVEELQRRINEGDLTKEGKGQSAWSPEISRLKQQASDLRNQITMLKEMMNPSLTPEERAINTLKRRLERNRMGLEERIKNLDFAKKQKPAPVTGPGVEKLREEERAVRDAFNAARKSQDLDPSEANELVRLSSIAGEKRQLVQPGSPSRSKERLDYGRAKSDFLDYADTLRHRSEKLKVSDFKVAPVRSALRAILEIPGLMKASAASLDNSSLGNQGLKVAIRNPKVWGRNAIKSFIDIAETIGGKDVMREIRADIFSRKNYMDGTYKKHRLYFGSEESFPTSLMSKMPILGRLFKASETAYTGFIHRSRADIFDFYYDAMTKAGLDTKGLGEHVNSLTGRGNMGPFEKASDVVNVALFSGRYLKSNIDMLTGGISGWGEMSPAVRKEAIKGTVIAYAVLGSLMFLSKQIAKAFGDEDAVELDPRSAAFGKIQLGNTSIDYTGGASSLFTLVSRAWGSKNKRTGVISPVFSDDRVAMTAMDLLGRFGEGKLAPSARLIFDLLNNMKDWKGEPIRGIKEVSRVTPITISNAVEGFEASEGNLPVKIGKSAGITIASGVGLGTSSDKETPEQLVKDAKSVEKELARMERVGDSEGYAALKERNERLLAIAGKTKTLRIRQEAINDIKSEISLARQDMRLDPEDREDKIETLKEKMKDAQEALQEYLDEIK